MTGYFLFGPDPSLARTRSFGHLAVYESLSGHIEILLYFVMSSSSALGRIQIFFSHFYTLSYMALCFF